MSETMQVAKRTAINFVVLAASAFVLFVLAAIINFLGQLVGLSSPNRLIEVALSVGNSSTMQAIISIWLLTAAVVIALPSIWKPFATTTALMFDVGYAVLGALAGFGLAIGSFGGNWTVLIWALVYSAIIAVGYWAVGKFMPMADLEHRGRMRWILVGVLVLAAPIILLWG